MSWRPSTSSRSMGALLLAAHPAPAAAVTAVAGLLAVGAGCGAATTVRVLAAVGVGQLSVGWCNDWWDAARDIAVARPDKPVATGRVARSTVGRAAAVGAALTVPASLLLGWRAGVVHLLAVGSAWAYNLLLKGTALSWLPFAVSFGLLPAVATLARPTPGLAPVAVLAGGAVLGVGAHLVNVLPDLADDAATGVRGAGHRLGAARAALLAPACFAVAAVVVALGTGTARPAGERHLLVLLLVAAVIVVSAVAVALARRGYRVAALAACAAAAAGTLLLLVLSGGLRAPR